MTYKLFLDDIRNPEQVTWRHLPPGPWVVVRSYDEFKATIRARGVPSFLAYDHDLADIHYWNNEAYEQTGAHAATYLCDLLREQNLPHPNYVVHSQNPVGANRITNIIEYHNRNLE